MAETMVIEESPVFFEAGGFELFGVLARPERPNGVGVLIIQGGDTVNVSLMRNRMAVRMARDLATRGYLTLRFDYHGMGESTGTIGELRLSAPFTEDAAAAAATLRSQGAGPIVLVGACFSSRTALSTAPAIDDLAGVLMATPPIGSYERREAVPERMARDKTLGEYAALALRARTLKRLLDPARRAFYLEVARSKIRHVLKRAGAASRDPLWWVSRELVEPLEAMVERHVPVLIAYGVDDPLLREFDRAAEGRMGEIIGRSAGRVRVARDLPGVIHGFPSVEGQTAFLSLAHAWIDEVTSTHRHH